MTRFVVYPANFGRSTFKASMHGERKVDARTYMLLRLSFAIRECSLAQRSLHKVVANGNDRFVLDFDVFELRVCSQRSIISRHIREHARMERRAFQNLPF